MYFVFKTEVSLAYGLYMYAFTSALPPTETMSLTGFMHLSAYLKLGSCVLAP